MSVAVGSGNKRRSLCLIGAGCLVGYVLYLPEVGADKGEHGDHDRARHLMQTGEILPLERIVAGVAQPGKGRLLAVELERRKGVWIYEIKRMDEQGRLLQQEYDAQTGHLLRVKEEEGADE
ncbi:MAG: hypothetical protein HQM04_07580 [Magnetococcales bacterium]|nr:hypothetical protein [Magnetococcales bacterium]MBF0114892.1 hypothetical protein [Magnetococcales bacterium]